VASKDSEEEMKGENLEDISDEEEDEKSDEDEMSCKDVGE
jgi:hypothetical protein